MYDGAKRRVVKKTYDSGQLDDTRHFYYTDLEKWQVVEERVESSGTISSDPDRQFVWGLRYIDDLVLRDRDTDSSGGLDERLYALQDANWNVTAVADTSGEVQERYAYSAYGTPRVLTPTFAARASSNYGAEVSYAGYGYDRESALYFIRNRSFQTGLGMWLQRDPLGFSGGLNLYEYVASNPGNALDPYGTTPLHACLAVGAAGAFASLVWDAIRGGLDMCRSTVHAMLSAALGCLAGALGGYVISNSTWLVDLASAIGQAIGHPEISSWLWNHPQLRHVVGSAIAMGAVTIIAVLAKAIDTIAEAICCGLGF